MDNIFIIIAAVYLAVINLTAFAAFGIDKAKAVKGKWRIPEKTLIALMFLGGFIGGGLGMSVFRHKTKHLKFQVCAVLSAVLWIALIVWILYVAFI